MYFVFTIELNLLLSCFGLSALYSTYIETVDPARRPSIPQVRQGSVRFNSSEEEPPPSPFPFLLYTYSMLLMYWHLNETIKIIFFLMKIYYYIPHNIENGINNLNSKKSGSTCGVKYLGAKMQHRKVLLTVKETINSLYGNSSHLNQLYISAPISWDSPFNR